MTNWNSPTLADSYTSVLQTLKDRDMDMSLGLDPATTSPLNLPTGAFRWNSANARFETLNSSGVWNPSAVTYQINVSNLDGQPGSYYLTWGNFLGKPTTFPPSSHNHDTLYYTKTLGDARYGNTLVVSGNTLLLKSPSATTLSTITVPFATSAGNASTVNGKTTDQNLRTTDTVIFASVASAGDMVASGVVKVKGSSLDLWDTAVGVYRSLQYQSSTASWRLEDGAGTFQSIFHTGNAPSWGQVIGKPSTFTPSVHSHDFGTL